MAVDVIPHLFRFRACFLKADRVEGQDKAGAHQPSSSSGFLEVASRPAPYLQTFLVNSGYVAGHGHIVDCTF